LFTLKIGVLASGRGSNFQSIVDHIRLDVLHNVEIKALISNKRNAPALEIARSNDIEALYIPYVRKQGRSKAQSRLHHDQRIVDALQTRGIELVILAGYMRLLSPLFVDAYPSRIMNIHPSLLPKHPGLDVHEQVLNAGDAVSGCTVHFVNKEVDAGPIILQTKVPVRKGDTVESLAARVLVYEHRTFPKAIQLYAEKRLKVEGRAVLIDYSDAWEESWGQRQAAYIRYQETSWAEKGKPLTEVLRVD
jgi:phosphoribosylglycinamide formyltransferase-1